MVRMTECNTTYMQMVFSYMYILTFPPFLILSKSSAMVSLEWQMKYDTSDSNLPYLQTSPRMTVNYCTVELYHTVPNF